MGTRRVLVAQHGDVTRTKRARFTGRTIAHPHLGIDEQIAHRRRQIGGVLGEILRRQSPALDDGAEPSRLVGRRRNQPDARFRNAVTPEPAREHVRRQRHELRPAAPRLRQRFGLGTGEDRVDGGVHQRRVGAAESKDRLLLIADPDAARGDVGETEEDRELERARVLELVDQHEVELAAETRARLGPIEELEREHLLVGEIDGAPRALVVLVGLQCAGRDRVDERAGGGEVGAQAGVAVVGGARRLGHQHTRPRLHADVERLGAPPIGPLQRQAAPELAEDGLGFVERFSGLLGGVDGEIDLVDEAGKAVGEGGFELRTVGLRVAEEREQAVDAARGTARERIRADAIGARQRDDALDVALPIPLVVEASLHVGELLGLVGGHDARHRLAERHGRRTLVDHPEIGREAELERKVGDEAPADGVHRTDAGGAEAMRVLDPPRLQEPRPRALFQLGRGAIGERRREHGIGTRTAARDRVVQHAREAIGFAASRAGGDDLDLGHQASAPSVRKTRPQRVCRSQNRHGAESASAPSTIASSSTPSSPLAPTSADASSTPFARSPRRRR